MVTFNCEVCNDTVPKKNTEKHYYRCPNAYYTCIDCNVTFDDGVSYKAHTQCISEDERYQGALYKGKKQKGKPQQKPVQPQQPPQSEKAQNDEKPAAKVEKKKAPKSAKKSMEKPADASGISLAGKKGSSLYKILKSVKNKDEKKKLLKNLVVDEEGRLIYQNE
ncbi:LAFA_0F12948g1_1 [Lachancea sp. 'fantastica']|nr:LAFA_0F12948g1_1 [Lachancea sp. 'fantastica']